VQRVKKKNFEKGVNKPESLARRGVRLKRKLFYSAGEGRKKSRGARKEIRSVRVKANQEKPEIGQKERKENELGGWPGGGERIHEVHA